MKEPLLSNNTESLRCSESASITQNLHDKSNWQDPFAVIFEWVHDVLLVTDLKGDIKDLNTGICLLLGYKKEELLQFTLAELLDKEYKKDLQVGFDLLAEKEIAALEAKINTKNGDSLFSELKLYRIGQERILVIIRELAKRNNTRPLTDNYGAKFHPGFEKINLVILILDSQFRIVTWNPSALDFAENELGHIIGANDYFPDYFEPAERKGLVGSLQRVLEGEAVNFEQQNLRSDGSVHWYIINLGPISSADREVSGMIVTAMDITDLKSREKEHVNSKVQEQKNYLRAVLKDQEIERNNIGQELHDNVNQMLSTIRLYLGMIENEEVTRKELIDKSKAAIDLVIEEIRLLSRQQVTPQRKFNLSELIEDLIRNLNEHTRISTKFDIRVSIESAVDEDLKLNIYRIVQEQINNILKHAAASKVSLSLKANNQVIQLRITDNGIGFDPLLKRKGIGISNIFNRVESYNGQFSLISRPGAGCKLEICIPNIIHCK